ncbi:MAG: hypothetical protein JWP46_2378 [Modestobacter sp.]|nr:hypothetical protein [Modestobacter sp.]
MTLHVAGRVVEDPMSIWAAYAKYQRRALRVYDLPGAGHPAELTSDEVWRSRAIISHVTHAERLAFPEIWSAAGGPDLEADARITDADPLVRGGLYDRVQAVVAPFVARKGVRYTKAYKVLHIKRPALFPILDSQLRRLYEEAEASYRRDNREKLPDDGFNYWGAIRLDVRFNQAALDHYRVELADRGGPLEQLATLSDIRLLDIISWRLAKQLPLRARGRRRRSTS